jgi:hypothetical protein
MKNDAYSRFLEKYPAFKDTTALDLLRKKEDLSSSTSKK